MKEGREVTGVLCYYHQLGVVRPHYYKWAAAAAAAEEAFDSSLECYLDSCLQVSYQELSSLELEVSVTHIPFQ